MKQRQQKIDKNNICQIISEADYILDDCLKDGHWMAPRSKISKRNSNGNFDEKDIELIIDIMEDLEVGIKITRQEVIDNLTDTNGDICKTILSLHGIK